MLGKTHMVIGIAAGLAVVKPDTFSELVFGAGIAAMGGLISDIDVGTSDSHRDADRVTYLAVFVVLAVVVLEHIFHLGIARLLIQNDNVFRICIGLAGFVGICAFGKEQPHRTFMHSLLAMVLLSFCLGLLSPVAVPYFAVGFLSHIVTDLFNRKRVQVWYPFPGGLCLGLFHAHGLANTIFFFLGSVAAGAEVLMSMGRILF